MPLIITILILSVIGRLVAHSPDIDLNRVKLISPDRFGRTYPNNYHKRRSIIHFNRLNNYDYDNNSSRFVQLRAPMQFLHNTQAPTTTKAPLKVHEPREDPRTFYQSDTYIKETDRKNVNREVSYVYPGREVVKADDDRHITLPVRHYRRRPKDVRNSLGPSTCLRCPHDRTLIAKVGIDRVMLQYPRLKTCSGRRASKNVQFMHMYGPKFGALLGQGSHVIVGHITLGDQILQTCKMQIHVVMQFCHVPKYLVARCEGDQNKTCDFMCRDPKKILQGHTTLTCEDNMQWNAHLPTCKYS